jgi:predicted NUDIX family NTP pyrophosphohydrolase
MPKISAGLILYKWNKNKLEVFLVHPGGPFWAKKDAGAWSIPKGEYSPDEQALNAAKREFKEETGQTAPKGEYVQVGEVKYGNKKVIAWAIQADFDANIKSNYFEMEWPLKSGQTQQFLEVDKAGWFNITTARKKLVKGQVAFMDQLLQKLNISENAQQTLF